MITADQGIFFVGILYQAKKYEGAITDKDVNEDGTPLYQAKKYEGAITSSVSVDICSILYQAKKYEGAITSPLRPFSRHNYTKPRSTREL